MFRLVSLLSEEVYVNSKSEKLNKLFRFYMKNIYSSNFYSKLDKFFEKKIQLKEDTNVADNVIAYTKGNSIYINPNSIYKKSGEDAVVFLLHETIHLLENNSKIFPEIKNVEKKLWEIVSKNLIGDISEFYTGKKQSLHSNPQDEVLTYLFNGSIHWKYVKPTTKERYFNILKESGIFNMNSNFLKKRFDNLKNFEYRSV